MQSELPVTAPAHATGAVEFVSLDDIAPDDRFRLRAEGDVAGLASSLGRLGQLVPVELRPLPGATEEGPRWQVVAGFRRLSALRLLFRDRVLARLHRELPDEEAWALALSHAVLGEPLTVTDLDALRARLQAEGVAPWAGELLDEATARAPLDAELREKFFEFLKGPLAPVVERVDVEEELVEEVEPDELVRKLALRLYEVNQDLAAAFSSWKELPREGREAVLVQARYVAELFPLLVEESRE